MLGSWVRAPVGSLSKASSKELAFFIPLKPHQSFSYFYRLLNYFLFNLCKLYFFMQIAVKETENSIIYKLLTGLVIPRPIGWISTIDENGINNLAPFSFFNVVGEDPPHVMFSTVRTGNKNKDTLNNVLSNKQFAVNLVTEDLVEQVNTTSEMVDSSIDEFQLAHLTPISSEMIKPMRVQEAKAHFECEMVHHYFLEEIGARCAN